MNILDKLIKYLLYSLVFFTPIFFLPLTIFPVAFNKQVFLAVFCFLIFILWMIKIISSGTLRFISSKLNVTALLLISVLGLSSVFSSAGTQSFWGTSIEPDTFFNFILYGLVFFFFANLIGISQNKADKSSLIAGSKNEVFKILSIFLASSGILALLFLINCFKQFLPWDFARFSGFNPVGSAQALSLYLGGAFVILVAFSQDFSFVQSKLSIVKKGLLYLLGVLLFATILLINSQMVWVGLVIAMIMIFWQRLKYMGEKINISQSKILILPAVVLALSLVLVFVRAPFGNVLNIAPDISLTYQTTIDIAQKTLKESPKNLILGSGPATFAYQYSLYKPADINLTNFWQLRFSQGAATMATFLTTIGIAGVLAILLMMGIFFYRGVKNLLNINLPKSGINGIGDKAFIGASYFFVLWFLSAFNFSLAFTGFMMLGLWQFCSSEKKAVKEISLVKSPQKTFFLMLGSVILIAVSAVAIYIIGQRYAAALYYEQGIKSSNQEELDQAITSINKAINFDNKKDFYFRNLSQLFLLKINQALNNQELSQEQRQTLFQQNISEAEKSAGLAVQINNKESLNWLQLGNIYENIIILVDGADQMAVKNYNKAAELDPQNPQIPLNIGRAHIIAAQKIQSNIANLTQAGEAKEAEIKALQESYNNNLGLALKEFEKAIALKNNFGPAYYLTAQIYEIQGNNAQALQNYQIVLQLEPNNKEARARIEALSQTLRE